MSTSIWQIEIPEEHLPTIEQLDGDLRMIAEEVGVEAAIRIGKRFLGTSAQTNAVKTLLRQYRDSLIRWEYDQGASCTALARKWGLDVRTIQKIVGQPDEIQAALPAPQLRLFG